MPDRQALPSAFSSTGGETNRHHSASAIVPGIRAGSLDGARQCRPSLRETSFRGSETRQWPLALRRPPVAALDWRRRSGPTGGHPSISPAATASLRRWCPAAPEFPTVRPNSLYCPRGTAASCNPPATDSCPANERPSTMPSREESSLRRSSIGHGQMVSSRPADAFESATLPRSAAFRLPIRLWAFTCSTASWKPARR